jgi:hypothetical protein
MAQGQRRQWPNVGNRGGGLQRGGGGGGVGGRRAQIRPEGGSPAVKPGR